MMTEHRWTAAVTLVALLVYFGMGLQVAFARGKTGIKAPQMSGDPLLDRAVRVHLNTLEGLPMFLGGLWLFAIFQNERMAAGLGVVWIVGRLAYSVGYMAHPDKRSLGFLIQMVVTATLLIGALGRVLYSLATGGV